MTDQRIEDFAHYKRIGSEPVPMWTIYAFTSDFPGVPYVARKWEVLSGSLRPTDESVLCNTLGEARAVCRLALGAGAVCFARSSEDDPVIVETWM